MFGFVKRWLQHNREKNQKNAWFEMRKAIALQNPHKYEEMHKGRPTAEIELKQERERKQLY
jgi:hypothetical protein